MGPAEMELIKKIVWKGRETDVLRLDLLHPLYGGNKWFKLKYNLEKAGEKPILTFGGAHSNHIYSTAAFCAEKKIRAIGVIRGRKEDADDSPTLCFARDNGMILHFVSNRDYGRKIEPEFLGELSGIYGKFHLVPEGGNNADGVKGCTEILSFVKDEYDHIFCACGTGATFAGIYLSAPEKAIVTGISVLKGENQLNRDAERWMKHFASDKGSPTDDAELAHSGILSGYHFGGYAAFSEELVAFKENIEKETGIPLDHIYTSKLFFAVTDLIERNKIRKDKRTLLIHSGGQQGNEAFEKRFGIQPTSQNLPGN